MKLYESGEDYLEAILRLSRTQTSVRSVDVAAELGFSKPSVSVAMKHLREGGLVVTESDGSLKLTPAGLAVAEQVWERHSVLTSLFTRLGVSPEVARADACKIEHDLSQETFEKIKAWVATMSDGEDETAN
ncbi:MAG: metal-dependent transcriptional regulator [Eubacteriales bacterium]